MGGASTKAGRADPDSDAVASFGPMGRLLYLDAILGPETPGSEPPDREAVDEAEALDAYSNAVIRVAERLAPSVANLRVSRRVRGGRVVDGGGSGVVITPDGFLLTSAHVVAGASGGTRASFADGRELELEPVGADPLSDLAVLRADARRPRRRRARRRRAPAGGPARGGDRQSQRLRRLGHRGRRLRARPVAADPFPIDLAHGRERHPDRRLPQPRQLGRRAGGQPGARHRDQYCGRRRRPRPGRPDQRGDAEDRRGADGRRALPSRLRRDRDGAASAAARGWPNSWAASPESR